MCVIRSIIVMAMALGLNAALAAGQSPADVRQFYDAGRYGDVVRAAEAASADADSVSRLQYLAAQSYSKLKDNGQARNAYQRLADRGGSPWAAVGQSAMQVMDGALDEALASADQAVRLDGSLPEAHYQRGIVLMARKDYGAAVDAFSRTTDLDPAFASAYYYAGLANYRVKRIDLMTNNFGVFVKLAPDAPERPEVESILRTVRGR